jgi:hypothetical protein
MLRGIEVHAPAASTRATRSPAKQFSHDIASRNTLCKRVSMPTVRAVDGIFSPQICTHTDSYGFFAHVQVYKTRYLGAAVKLLHFQFELPELGHLSVKT